MKNVNALVRALTLGMKHQENAAVTSLEIQQLSLEFVEANKEEIVPKNMIVAVSDELFLVSINDESQIEKMTPIGANTVSLIAIEECADNGYKAIGKGSFSASDKIEPTYGATANDGEDDTPKEENTATDLENGGEEAAGNNGNEGEDALAEENAEKTTST